MQGIRHLEQSPYPSGIDLDYNDEEDDQDTRREHLLVTREAPTSDSVTGESLYTGVGEQDQELPERAANVAPSGQVLFHASNPATYLPNRRRSVAALRAVIKRGREKRNLLKALLTKQNADDSVDLQGSIQRGRLLDLFA